MNSTYSVDLLDRGLTFQTPATGLGREGNGNQREEFIGLSGMVKTVLGFLFPAISQTVTTMKDPWVEEQTKRDAGVSTCSARKKMLISEIGWSQEQVLETRMRLLTFEDDWNVPGMEGYDDM